MRKAIMRVDFGSVAQLADAADLNPAFLRVRLPPGSLFIHCYFFGWLFRIQHSEFSIFFVGSVTQPEE